MHTSSKKACTPWLEAQQAEDEELDRWGPQCPNAEQRALMMRPHCE